MACVGKKIGEIAKQYPERVAIETSEEQITYEEFYQSSHLLQRKISYLLSGCNERKVGFLVANEPKWLELFIAISLSGGIAIPFDPKWSPHQVNAVIKDAQPDLVIYDHEISNQWKDVTLPHAFTTEEFDLFSPPQVDSHPFISDQDPFYIGYTSGTTGQPKGFIRSHASWADCFPLSSEVFSLDEKDGILCPGPLVHSHFLYAAVQCLHIGATLHLLPIFNGEKVWEYLQKKDITVMYIVPTMFEAINKIRNDQVAPGLQTLISSGAKWAEPAKQIASQVFPEAAIYEFYGASELSFVSLREMNNSSQPEGTIGRPFPHVEISILTDEGVPVKQGDVGNLFVKSPWVFDGYLNRPAETADVFHRDWATVGDLAYMNQEGHVILKGRKKNMIISGGLNIYPEEIEQVISEHPAVDEAAVLGVEDDYWGEKVVAFFTCVQGEQLIIDEMKDSLTKQLPKYKCPKEWVELDEFPYTSSGKIARKDLLLSKGGVR